MTLELRKLGGLCGQLQAGGWSLAGSPGSGDQLVGLQVLCWLVFMTPVPGDQPQDMFPLPGKLEFRRLKSQRVVSVDGPKNINKARRW